MNTTVHALLEDLLHQLSTDADLEGLVGWPKYQDMTQRLRAALDADARSIDVEWEFPPIAHLDERGVRQALLDLRHLLYWDPDDDDDYDQGVYNRDRDWDSDTLLDIAAWAAEYGLRPPERADPAAECSHEMDQIVATPEHELILISAKCRLCGATTSREVNLSDFEWKS